MVAAPRLHFTFREYLLVDENSDVKHEYLDGMILGMAGGTPEHARLAVAVSGVLQTELAGRRCAVFSEALRIRSKATGFAGYPDVSVVCEELVRDPADRNTVLNPSVVVEVLSPSTADYDRGEKLRQYQTIESLEHVVLVDHERPSVEVWSRSADTWSSRTYGAGERAELAAVGATLDVDAVYRDPLAR